MQVERQIIRHLIRTMKKAKWNVFAVSDGGNFERMTKETEVMDTVFSVDESTIVFQKIFQQRTVRASVYIVLGNDGYDCIADHSMNSEVPGDDFEETMEIVNDYAMKFDI